jgi:hypothetical protein
LAEERSADGLKAVLEKALEQKWDRTYIETVGRSRTWDSVADDLAPIFSSLSKTPH